MKKNKIIIIKFKPTKSPVSSGVLNTWLREKDNLQMRYRIKEECCVKGGTGRKRQGTGERGGLPHPYQVKHRREETINIKSNPALHTHTNPFDGQIYFHLKRPSLKADFVAELRVVMFEQQPENLCVCVPSCVCVCVHLYL